MSSNVTRKSQKDVPMEGGRASVEQQTAGEPKLAALLETVLHDRDLDPPKRAQWAWAIRTTGKYLDRPLEALPARLSALRFGITRLHPVQLGTTEKNFQNWRSALRGVLGHYVHTKTLPSRGQPLSQAWQALHDRIVGVHPRRSLAGFMRYCSGRGVEPHEAGDETVLAFKAARESESFTNRLNQHHRGLCQLWNKCSDTVPGWPTTRLTVPSFRSPIQGLTWESLPESLRADAEAYLEANSRRRSIGANLAAILDGPVSKPWAPATVRQRREQIRLAASAATKSGIAIDQLSNLGDLVKPAVAIAALEHYLARDERALGRREPKSFTISLAYALYSIAKEWVKPDQANIDGLQKAWKGLAQHEPPGMTPKNMTLIRALMDPTNKARLLALPAKLMAEANAQVTQPYHAAVTAQLACAIALLLVAPMRLKNLASLRQGVEILRPGGAGGLLQIHIAGHDVKNNVELEYPLPRAVSMMLDHYNAKHRPHLLNPETIWLFPGEGGLHKGKRNLGQQLKERVYKEIGISITAHQFRHAAAAWLLLADPGNYELVRRVLGHKDMNTTTRFYVGLESMPAMRRYQQILYGHGAADGDRATP